MIEYFDSSASAYELAFSPDGQFFAFGSAFGDVVLARSGISTAVPGHGGFSNGRILEAPAPNPLRVETTLRFNLDQSTGVRLSIHDVRGRRVVDLLSGTRAAGEHTVKWNGRNANGQRVAPGIYFARIALEREIATRKLVVIQ
jgi:hypothetical protein